MMSFRDRKMLSMDLSLFCLLYSSIHRLLPKSKKGLYFPNLWYTFFPIWGFHYIPKFKRHRLYPKVGIKITVKCHALIIDFLFFSLFHFLSDDAMVVKLLKNKLGNMAKSWLKYEVIMRSYWWWSVSHTIKWSQHERRSDYWQVSDS